MTLKHYLLAICAILTVSAGLPSCGSRHSEDNGTTEEKRDTIYPLGFLTDTLVVESGKVGEGDFFSVLMDRLGLPGGVTDPLIKAGEGLFDVRKIRIGADYDAYYTKDSLDRQLHYFVYHNGKLDMTVFRCFDSLAVWKSRKPVERVSKSADVTITTSLGYDIDRAGGSQSLTNELADIYSWTIDFFGLQAGDRVRVFYDELLCDGVAVDVDTVRYAIFTHAGKDYEAVMFNQKDGGNIYWNEKGESLQKAFLKAPLHFTRISSGFTYNRRHPITRRVQPHTAIDYAAPAGTPVVSIGDGTVISAGYSGAAGNMVKIKHDGTWQSAYLHLSKYGAGIKAGAKVRQGQVIGYVGSTGRSTGPHLDFRVWKNGQPVNPLKIDSPSLAPAHKENLPAIDSLARYWRNLL